VQQVISRKGRVIVSGANVVKKHQKPVRAGRGQVQPGIIELEAPLDLSNVMLVCTQCDSASRVRLARDEDGSSVRVCKKCGEAID
jgi:large subunit ribosomal protein L24